MGSEPQGNLEAKLADHSCWFQVNVGSYLQLVCLAENVRTDAGDLSSLLHWTGGDVRQSLLQLQFWVRSGGGHPAPRPFLAPPPESAGTGPCTVPGPLLRDKA